VFAIIIPAARSNPRAVRPTELPSNFYSSPNGLSFLLSALKVQGLKTSLGSRTDAGSHRKKRRVTDHSW
jgi:hypothetical protein